MVISTKVGTKRAVFSKIGIWITEFSARGSLVLTMVLLSLLGIFITMNVILRTIGVSTDGFYEITILIIVAFVLTGAAYTQKGKGHIVLDFITTRLSPKGREILNCLALFLGLVFSVLFIWRLVILTHSLWVTGAFSRGMVSLPHWPSYIVACLGFIFFVIILIAHFIQSVKQNVENFRRSPR